MTSILNFIWKTLLTAGSLACLVSVPSAFVQTLPLALLILFICGLVAIFGHLKFAILNVFILCLALAVSPLTDMALVSSNNHWVISALACTAFAFFCLLVGVFRLQ